MGNRANRDVLVLHRPATRRAPRVGDAIRIWAGGEALDARVMATSLDAARPDGGEVTVAAVDEPGRTYRIPAVARGLRWWWIAFMLVTAARAAFVG
jgi:hypothetical protein